MFNKIEQLFYPDYSFNCLNGVSLDCVIQFNCKIYLISFNLKEEIKKIFEYFIDVFSHVL